ncbi:MAG: hypothetical protein F4X15_06215 [Gemmatimonadetes bacterium]|nr:hypothetical protein [Gemmatimonadota bacterium]
MWATRQNTPGTRWFLAVFALPGIFGGPFAAGGQSHDGFSTDPTQDAYLDEEARRLVLGTKAARDTALLAIDSYTALVRERMGLSLSIGRRDRRLGRGESTARIRWSRDEPEVVRFLGSRFESFGFLSANPSWQVGFRQAADPLRDPFTFGFSVLGADSVAARVRSPLDLDSERFYQFRSGDTISVALPDGRFIQAVEVTAIPRYRGIQLVAAVMWIEPESFGLVRVAYRLAKRLDSEVGVQLRGGDGPFLGLAVELGDGLMAWDSVTSQKPGRLGGFVSEAVNSLLPRWELDITTVVADYALWDLRHWLPRTVRWQGYLGVVDDVGEQDAPQVVEPISYEWVFSIEDIRERGAEATADTPETAIDAVERWSEDGDSISGEADSTNHRGIVVILPRDKEALATSDHLPPAIWDASIGGVDDHAVEEIGSMLAAIGFGEGGDEPETAACPCHVEAPFRTLRLLRYNSTEGLSVGTRMWWDLGWGRAVGAMRIRTAYGDPDFSFTLQHDRPQIRLMASLYRNVYPFHTARRGRSVSGNPVVIHATRYRETDGVAIRFLPRRGKRNWGSLRLFAERNSVASTGHGAAQIGASARLTPWWGGLSDRSVAGGGEIVIRGSTGDNSNVSASVTGALAVPLGSKWSAALEAGTARIWGDPAEYELWSLGGSGDRLRGYPEDGLTGRSFWRGRAELLRSTRFFRVAVFADWATVRSVDLYSAGVGLVLVDGLVRIDVARGLTSNPGIDGLGSITAGWQLHWRADSLF